jgi:hypothetical protein
MIVTAVQIAKEMRLPPKRVRAILRSRGVSKAGGRWEFPSEQRGELKRLIRSVQRKPSRSTLH